MGFLLAGLALLTAVLVAGLLFKRRAATAPAPATRERPRVRAEAPAMAHDAEAPAVSAIPIPPELAGFSLRRARDLPAERQAAYLATFRDVPRPPKLLHQLMSPEFLNAANSVELVDLITAEPLIAAKVLKTVNSPLFGLKNPVTSVGQAVTYLGLSMVRSLCLQYILIAAFKADSAERQEVLDATWRASALASELTHQLSYRVALPEPGLTVSAVVLSFLGRLATAATMPRTLLAQVPSRDLLARARAEQERMGLPASEIGRLLMVDWELPERIVSEAADIDTLLVRPSSELDPARRARLALAYLCARLGERLAAGELPDLIAFDLNSCADRELFHLRGYLADPALSRLGEYLRTPMLSADLQRMLAAWRG